MSAEKHKLAIRMKLVRTLPETLPLEFIKDLNTWENVFKSPYGNSYYNAKVNWGFKPNGSLRISDHWNFESHGKFHCQTLNACENNSHWTIAKFCAERNKYIVIESIPKKVVDSQVLKTIEVLKLKEQLAIFMVNEKNLSSEKKNKIIKKIKLFTQKSYIRVLENSLA